MRQRRGRMINKDISSSDKFASLSPEAAVLFAMLIPHFNSYGKMNGGPGFIKDEICPKVPYLTYKNIPKLLREISDNTNVKHFESNGRFWIHSINFLSDHQDLREDRMGEDLLPDYSVNCDGQRLPEVKIKIKSKGKVKIPMPDNFSISERVSNWAKGRGYINLDEHLESFKLKAAAKNYCYADWDAAFMNAIRDNWAKIGESKKMHRGDPGLRSPITREPGT